MNFFEYKNAYFAGDEFNALHQLAKEYHTCEYTFCKTKNDLQVILDSMDKKTANKFRDFLHKEIKQNFKNLKPTLDIVRLSRLVGLDLDEVIKRNKNPFIKKFIFNLLAILGGIIIFAVLLFIKEILYIYSDVYNYIASVFPLLLISLLSTSTVSNLLKIFRFKKIKKIINNENKFGTYECYSTINNDISSNSDATTYNSFNDLSDLHVKEKITISSIVQFLRAHYRNQRDGSLCVGIILSVLFGSLSFVSKIQYMAIPVFFVSFGCFLIMYINAIIKLKKTESLNFYILIDKCINKKEKIDTENNFVTDKYLFFENSGKYYINYQHSGMFAIKLTQKKLYDSVSVGDDCYVLLFESNKKIQLVLPKKLFYFGEEEFNLYNNEYYPIKNVDAEALIEKEIQNQQKELSDKQIKAIEEANQKINNAKPKIRILTVCSIFGIMLTILGVFVEKICFYNICFQPFIFLIPIFISFIAARKTKIAVEKVRFNYIAFSELHYKQNSIAGKTLGLLAADIFSYLINFLFISVIYM